MIPYDSFNIIHRTVLSQLFAISQCLFYFDSKIGSLWWMYVPLCCIGLFLFCIFTWRKRRISHMMRLVRNCRVHMTKMDLGKLRMRKIKGLQKKPVAMKTERQHRKFPRQTSDNNDAMEISPSTEARKLPETKSRFYKIVTHLFSRHFFKYFHTWSKCPKAEGCVIMRGM